MMKILCFEIRKLFTGKSPLVFLLIVLLAAVFFDLRQGWDRYYPYEAYAALCSDVLSLPENEREAYLRENTDKYTAFYNIENGIISTDNEENAEYILQYENSAETTYTDSIFLEYYLFSDVYEQYMNVAHYSEHLSDILAQADSMSGLSVFGNANSFEQKNISATAEVYGRLNNVTPCFSDTVGLNDLLSFSPDQLLILAAAVFGAFFIVMEERRTGSIRIAVVTKNGKSVLALGKLGALFIWCAANVVLLFAAKLAITGVNYDVSALFLPIQSVQGFLDCPYDITAAGFIALSLFFEIIASFICTLLFAFIFTVKKYIAGSIAGVILIALQFVMYQQVDNLSFFGALKYFNLSAVLHFFETGKTFTAVNIFQAPVSTVAIISVFTLFFTLLLCIAFTASFAKSDLNFHELSLRIKSGRIPPVSLFHSESHRTLVINGGLFVLIILLALSIYDTANDKIHYEAIDGYYELYLNEIDGMTLSETADFITAEEKQLSDLQDRLFELGESYQNSEISSGTYMVAAASLQNELAKRPAFQLLVEQYSYISEENPSADFVCYMNINKYMNMGEREEKGIRSVLYMQLALLLMICPLFAGFTAEEQRLVSCTKNGQAKLLRIRLYICILSAITIFLCTNLPELVALFSENRPSDLSAAVQSLAYFRDAAADMSIGLYFALIYSLRFGAILITAFIAAFIGIIVKNRTAVLVVCSALILLPTVLYFTLSSDFVNFGLIPASEGNLLLRQILIGI